jgi:hypothetical protein
MLQAWFRGERYEVEEQMKTFDMRVLVAAVASTMLAIGAAHAQTSSGTTSQGTGAGQSGNQGMGQGQAGGAGKGAETGKGGQMATPGSPNAARSGMWDAALFDRLDTNKDGKISREEAQADPMVRDAWSQLDAKNAGNISRADFDRFGAARNPANAGTTTTTGNAQNPGPTSSGSQSGTTKK